MNLILGSGLAGLSCSYHLGHENCLLLEARNHPYGHIHSVQRDGFTWDEGPHVSFTKHEYVKDLFAKSVEGEFEDYEVKTSNYFEGSWIDHPAQSNLYQIPEPLRSRCLDSFLQSRESPQVLRGEPANYQEWLEIAFGKIFANTFPAAYTRKYWTCDPSRLTTDWVGGRVFKPKVEDVVNGAKGPLDNTTHYITRIRYPKKGGYQSFARKLAEGADIRFGAKVVKIDLEGKKLWTETGQEFGWDRLINTLPLPDFVNCCFNVPPSVVEAADALLCSELVLVNATAPHSTLREENWMYVYDEDKFSTRINCTERLTAGNAPGGYTGVQVEVYGSRRNPFSASTQEIQAKVVEELREMELLRHEVNVESHTVNVPWANVIFTHETSDALDMIWKWLGEYGLEREEGDLAPMTDWAKAQPTGSDLLMAGRFGQWKYFWTDDCVLRGRQFI